jgi:DNA-3-methyladenine glycosylase II
VRLLLLADINDQKSMCIDMRLTLIPTPPFNFDLSASIFSDGDEQIRKYEKGRYWQVISVKDNLIFIILKASGTIDKPKLLVELKSDKEISNSEKKKINEIVRSLFNLDLDLKSFYEEVKNDRIMSRIVHRLIGLKSPSTETAFEALISSITQQQIALNVASNIERKIIKAFGDRLKLKDKLYYAFPTPEKLATVTVEQLRKCGLSQRKAEYIIGISKLITEKKLDLDKLKNYKTEEIIKELSQIRGIGAWTAELTMVRGMHRQEAIPADDLGLLRHVSHYYFSDRKISPEDLRRVAENWGDWKGLAGFYLIVAQSLDITPEELSL